MQNDNMNTPNTESNPLPDWLEILAAKAASLRFGSLQVTIHEGKVVQIECHERTRIDLSREAVRGESRKFAAQ
jgi:hypothetical protein